MFEILLFEEKGDYLLLDFNVAFVSLGDEGGEKTFGGEGFVLLVDDLFDVVEEFLRTESVGTQEYMS